MTSAYTDCETSSGMTPHNLADSHQMLCYQIPNQS